MEAENYRLTSREVWQAMAPGWERWRSQLADALSSLREWLIRELGPQPGETVLELGAGTGETGFEAAASLGQDGRLISTDVSPAMLAAARRRGGERGLANVDYRLIDAERIELEADSVDGVVTGIEGPRANAPRPWRPPQRSPAYPCGAGRRQAAVASPRGRNVMRRTAPLVVGLAVVLLSGAEPASAIITANTIDEQATYTRDGARVRATGPIGCTRGGRVSIGVAVSQPATAARARNRWKGRCTGKVQHWQVRARARRGTRFENGGGRVCAVANTRTGSRVTDTRRWCERVDVSAVQSRGRDKKITAAGSRSMNEPANPLQ